MFRLRVEVLDGEGPPVDEVPRGLPPREPPDEVNVRVFQKQRRVVQALVIEQRQRQPQVPE